MAIVLAVLLYVLAFMLFYTIEPVSINLNGGKSVIEVQDIPFMPGMTVEKPFYIGNEGSQSVYYKIYFDCVSGKLADVMEVTVLNGSTVLYEGTAESLTRDSVKAVDDILLSGERRYLTVKFHLPEDATFSGGKSVDMKFEFCVDAVRTKNNPDRSFE